MNKRTIERLEARGWKIGSAEEFLGMETLGSIIDRLVTVDMKLWSAQDKLYQIRKMSYVEFLENYMLDDTDGALELYEIFNKSMDLNMQRNGLIDQIDETLESMIEKGEGNVQRKHKTY